MATVEQLLVKIGVDPASVNRFLQDVNRVVDKAEDQEVNIAVKTTAGRNIASVTRATQALGAAAQRTTTAFQQGLTQVRSSANELRTGLLALSAVAGIGLAGSIRAASAESTNFARANVILRLSEEDLIKAQNDLRAVADETGLEQTGPDLKLIVDLESGKVELFDLSTDPDERTDLSDSRPEEVETLRRLVEGFGAEQVREGREPLELTDEEQARLKALGYL